MKYGQVETPIGRLTVAASDMGVRRVLWEGEEPPDGAVRGTSEVLDLALSQIREYFAGTRQAFDIPLELIGTPFQQKVWRELAGIPYGSTISYGEQARRVGRPTAARAVGAANGRNPVPVILPCHRVIGAGGALTGFGGGLDVKQRLLEHETGVLRAR